MQTGYQLIFFNKDAFDAAGLDYPEAGWTWDDALAMAQELTIRDGDEVTQWGFVEPNSNPAGFVELYAGRFYDGSSDPPTFDLEDPAVAEAVAWYTDLVTEYEAAPYYPQN